MWTKCVVATHDSEGKPSLYGCHIQVSKKDYEEGEHYPRAAEKARRAGYSYSSCVVFDEADGPPWFVESVFNAMRKRQASSRSSGSGLVYSGDRLLDRLEDEIVKYDGGGDDLRKPGMLEAYFKDGTIPEGWMRWPWVFSGYGPRDDTFGGVSPFSIDERARGIHTMFYRLYRTMAVAVLEEQGESLGMEIGRDVQVYVEAFDDYDCTALVVCDRRGLERPVVLVMDHFKPWGLRWDTSDELGRYLCEICERIEKGLEEA